MLLTEKSVLLKIKKLEDEGYIWKPLGGNANNEGLIQMLTDPGAGLAERITNAIDGVLEKYYLEFNSSAKTPRDLANEIKSKMAADKLKELVHITIYNSESKNKDHSISIVITDKGTGIKGADFENTILRLSGDNKLTKKYLMGSYGQGGSTSVKFNQFTVIYSKAKKSQEVMTIIRYNPGTSEMKNGSYEYIAKNGANNIAYFAPSNALNFQGTKIVNVATFHKQQLIASPNKKIESLLTNRLFNPPLPFTLEDKRQNSLFTKETIVGAKQKLNKAIQNEEHFEKITIVTKQNSKIFLKWWVIMPNKDILLKELAGSCLKDVRMPFNFTMNGQTQGYDNASLLDEFELSFLKKRFFCEVDLTNIKKEEKRSIFSSSRENISKDGDFWEEIRLKISKYFQSSQKLRIINNKIKDTMTSQLHNDKIFKKKLKDVLKNYISAFAKGYDKSKEKANQEKVKKAGQDNDVKKDENEKSVAEILKISPSYFNIKGLQPLTFRGDNLQIKYETDALPEVVLGGIKIVQLPPFLKFISKKQNKGNGVLNFDGRKFPLEENFNVKLNILDGLFIKNVLVRKIDPLIKPKKPGYPKTNVVFITNPKDKNYKRLDLNKQRPCQIEYSKQTNRLTIYINFATYPRIEKYLNDPKLQKQFKNHYSIGLSLYIISKIQQNEYENSEISDEYDYNPIAKNLLWAFEKIRKIK